MVDIVVCSSLSPNIAAYQRPWGGLESLWDNDEATPDGWKQRDGTSSVVPCPNVHRSINKQLKAKLMLAPSENLKCHGSEQVLPLSCRANNVSLNKNKTKPY
jgi:hypothetical protein